MARRVVAAVAAKAATVEEGKVVAKEAALVRVEEAVLEAASEEVVEEASEEAASEEAAVLEAAAEALEEASEEVNDNLMLTICFSGSVQDLSLRSLSLRQSRCVELEEFGVHRHGDDACFCYYGQDLWCGARAVDVHELRRGFDPWCDIRSCCNTDFFLGRCNGDKTDTFQEMPPSS